MIAQWHKAVRLAACEMRGSIVCFKYREAGNSIKFQQHPKYMKRGPIPSSAEETLDIKNCELKIEDVFPRSWSWSWLSGRPVGASAVEAG